MSASCSRAVRVGSELEANVREALNMAPGMFPQTVTFQANLGPDVDTMDINPDGFSVIF